MGDLPVQVQAALIAAVVAVAGIFIRDLSLKFAEERRAEKKTELGVYRTYADPLATAAAGLLWRLNEVFYAHGRATFLIEQGTVFEEYKWTSTLYRIAALLGWIRAVRMELQFLPVRQPSQLAQLKSALRRIEAALADGPHVERERLEAVADLWDVTLPEDDVKLESLGVALDTALDRILQDGGVRVATALDKPEQLKLTRAISGLLETQLGVTIREEILSETLNRAMHRLSVREGWLYRDWQLGIGDYMIETAPQQAARLYQVIGFRDFEERVRSSDPGDELWIGRLERMVDGLDVTGDTKYDARVMQLRNLMLADAQLIQALAAIDKRQRAELATTFDKATEILRMAEGS